MNPRLTLRTRLGLPAVPMLRTRLGRPAMPGLDEALGRAGPAALGLLAVAWPLAWAPGWAYAVAVAGAACVLAAALARWPSGPVLAAAAAIVCCVPTRAGVGVLAAEGLFIMAYLLAADAPAGLLGSAAWGRWLRHQLRLGVAGLIAAGAVLGALALHQAGSAWLSGAGLAAAVAAYLAAVPFARRARAGGPPEQDSDVEVQ
jgi:hypothetical protein